ncbi:ABC transporter permease subunit [Parafrigoribacterium soli]|uniref:ABC transporter permease subunit n=1 Tax=Parafrigoribacterium soli TaxID=3144663 RepID=UPI0032ECD957
MTNTVDQRARAAASGLSFGGILRSEWIKLRTLRSTVWCYAIIIVVTIGFGLLVAATMADNGQTTRASQQSAWLQATTLGISFSQLVVAVLGALVITGEYGTGMIRSTLTAVPRRVPALAAKAIVFGVVTFVVSALSLIVTALVTAPLLSSKGIAPDLGDVDFWLALLGGAGYLALLGVLSLAIGTIIRNSAGGIAASLGLILVVPLIVQILAAITRADWAQNIGAFLPSAAGGRMYSYAPSAVGGPEGVVSLEPWQGLIVLAVWFLVMFVIGAVLLKRRDA